MATSAGAGVIEDMLAPGGVALAVAAGPGSCGLPLDSGGNDLDLKDMTLIREAPAKAETSVLCGSAPCCSWAPSESAEHFSGRSSADAAADTDEDLADPALATARTSWATLATDRAFFGCFGGQAGATTRTEGGVRSHWAASLR